MLQSYTAQSISPLLGKLHELFQDAQGEPKKLDFDEYVELMQTFTPDASRQQLKSYFDSMTVDGETQITLQQLLESGFFTSFIAKSEEMFSTMEETLTVEHEQQEQTIEKLQDYIENIGRPAERRVDELTYEMEHLHGEKSQLEAELRAVKEELSSSQSQVQSLQFQLEELQDLELRNQDEIMALSERSSSLNMVESELLDVEQELRRFKLENREFQKRINDLISTNSANAKMISQLQFNEGNLQMEIKRLNQKNERQAERLLELTEKCQSQTDQAQKWMAESLELRQLLEEAEDEYQEQADLYSGVSPSADQNAQPTLRIDSLHDFVVDLGFASRHNSVSNESMESAGLILMDDTSERNTPMFAETTNLDRLRNTLRLVQKASQGPPGQELQSPSASLKKQRSKKGKHKGGLKSRIFGSWREKKDPKTPSLQPTSSVRSGSPPLLEDREIDDNVGGYPDIGPLATKVFDAQKLTDQISEDVTQKVLKSLQLSLSSTLVDVVSQQLESQRSALDEVKHIVATEHEASQTKLDKLDRTMNNVSTELIPSILQNQSNITSDQQESIRLLQAHADSLLAQRKKSISQSPRQTSKMPDWAVDMTEEISGLHRSMDQIVRSAVTGAFEESKKRNRRPSAQATSCFSLF